MFQLHIRHHGEIVWPLHKTRYCYEVVNYGFYCSYDANHKKGKCACAWTCRSLLRHCATIWKASGLIPDGVIWIFHWHNPSDRTMALEATQPLTEMSTRNISWGRGGEGDRCVILTKHYPLHVLIDLKSWSLNLLEPSCPDQACNGAALPLSFTNVHIT